MGIAQIEIVEMVDMEVIKSINVKSLYLLFKHKLRILWLLLFTVATTAISYGQVPDKEDELDILLDELFFNEQLFIDDILNSVNAYNFIYANVSFNSNTFFSGRDSGIRSI